MSQSEYVHNFMDGARQSAFRLDTYKKRENDRGVTYQLSISQLRGWLDRDWTEVRCGQKFIGDPKYVSQWRWAKSGSNRFRSDMDQLTLVQRIGDSVINNTKRGPSKEPSKVDVLQVQVNYICAACRGEGANSAISMCSYGKTSGAISHWKSEAKKIRAIRMKHGI